MSRRAPNPSADRAAHNQQTLKTLVKIESNKSCADCKRNKHPRWASWNLGIFVCIRCSGIHRGMGTHISRVKSVDLDAWTDEQLQSMIRWGNARANKYWEAKLAPGHIPAEAKIENFIRTKYDSKRWTMEGGIPDPATLDVEGENKAPLEVSQAESKLDRNASLKSSSMSTSGQSALVKKQVSNADLFGEDSSPIPGKSNTETATTFRPPPPPKGEVTVTRTVKTGDSLLGFDFFNTPQPGPPARPSSAVSGQASSSIPSRPDLKQSILSLYSSSSKTSTPTPQQSSTTVSLGNQAPSTEFVAPQQYGSGGLDDAFSSLSFGSPPPSQQTSTPQKLSFSNLASPSLPTIPSAKSSARLSGSSVLGGSFFNPKLAAKAGPDAALPSRPSRQRGFSSSNGFGDFTSATSPTWGSPHETRAANGSNDMFDFSVTTAQPEPKMPAVSIASNVASSPFNLNSASKPAPMVVNTSRALNTDPWGSNEAWASSNSTATYSNLPVKTSSTTSVSTDAWNWAEAPSNNVAVGAGFSSSVLQPTHVAGDEDFGGWESSTMPTSAPPGKPPNAPPSKPAGFGGSDDLFSNVWE